MKEKNESKEQKNDSKEKLSQKISKEKLAQQGELKRKLEYNKERLSNQKQLYNDKKDDMSFYASHRHLFDHKKPKQNPLVNITKISLQTEYISEVNYLLQKLIFILILSILIFVETFLIIKNYKLYNEVTLSQIFSSFTFFISIFLIVELYREGLRDQFRHSLFRLFGIFFSISTICLFVSELMNIYAIYHKMQIRKEKCKANKFHCGDKAINTIILIFNVVHIFGIAIFAYFPIWFGIKSFKMLIGWDYEVYQKQLLENEKNENKGKDNKNEKKEVPKKDKKEHLKSE